MGAPSKVRASGNMSGRCAKTGSKAALLRPTRRAYPVPNALSLYYNLITTFVAMGATMSMPVRIDDELYEQAKADASAEHRSIAGQIEFWAKVGRAALDNPDIPASFIAESLISMAEPREHSTPFVSRVRRT